MNTGLLVLILASSTLGFVVIVSLMCYLLRQKRSAAEQDERKSAGYDSGGKDEYGSSV